MLYPNYDRGRPQLERNCLMRGIVGLVVTVVVIVIVLKLLGVI